MHITNLEEGGDELYRYDKKELMEILISKTKSLRHQVTFEEMKNDPTMPDPNLYAYYYRSFTEAAEAAYSASKRKRKEVKKMRKPYTRERCIELLQKKCDELGHVPTQLEIVVDENLPTWATLKRYLGPWNQWGDIVGYPFASQRLQKKATGAETETEAAETEVAEAEVTEAESTETEAVEVETEAIETEATDIIEVPIKIIMPKTFHGHLSITLDF